MCKNYYATCNICNMTLIQVFHLYWSALREIVCLVRLYFCTVCTPYLNEREINISIDRYKENERVRDRMRGAVKNEQSKRER